jgi:hypothetical protein
MLVDDRQPLERAAGLRAIEYEVPAPDMVFVLRATQVTSLVARAHRPFFPRFTGTFSPLRRHHSSTREALARQPSRRNKAAIRR